MRVLLAALLLLATSAVAHPGAAIAVAKDGAVWFVDTGGGVFSIDRGGRLVRHQGPAFHWFAFDENRRFAKTPWPHIPNGELQSAGAVILSSDFPVTIGSDGKFYFPDGSDRQRVRIVAIEPSGARSVHATLPEIRRGGETIAWINGLASGPDGSLLYAEDRAIRKIDRRGNVSTIIANVGVPECKAIPGVQPEETPYLRGLAVAKDGSIYVAASGCAAVLRIRDGRASTFLKIEPPWSPTAVAVAGSDLFVLEYLHTASDNRREWIARVRKISASGTMTILGTVQR
jgi:hypothetical protein